jgi:hypothetical protein
MFLHYGTCSYPNRYKVTADQIAEAKKEYERAKAAIYEQHYNDLLFVGMGMQYAPRFPEDVCNYRIRTQFRNREGHLFFIEILGGHGGDNFHVNHSNDVDLENALNHDFNKQHEYYNYKGLERTELGLKYTRSNVLELVNKYFDCKFERIIIDNHNIHPDDREVICESPK